MNPQKLTYDICRCYISDLKSTMPPDLVKKLAGYTRARDLDRLASCTTLSSPALSTLDQYRTLMQVEAFFKKNKSFSDETRCAATAMSSFNRGERICRITNRRLDHYYMQRDRLDPDLQKWVTRMEKDIHELMGPFKTFLDELPRLVRVTSGATSTRSRRNSLPHLRVSKKPYASPRASKYLEALSHYFGYGALQVKETLANRLEFVPKNWKTYRTIACEPEGNVFLQLAFDAYIKRRLRRIGIDLSNQSRNQALAYEGSVSGDLATIDLSMASDTLSFNTTAWLLPSDWFGYVNDVRSPRSRGVIETEYAKFSSMGNGCTFGLETLIFAAACRAVGSKRSVVYGDDIVIETSLVDDLIRLLHFLGFVVNTEKSHFSGPFRESCGANWYNGIDITPVYIRDIDRRKAMLCHLVNSLAAIAIPEGDLWCLLLDLIRDERLPCVPFNENTTSGILVSYQSVEGRKLIRTRGWVPKYKAYQPVAYKHRTRKALDSHAAFLWYLDTMERGRPPVFPPLNMDRELLRRMLRSPDLGVYVTRTRYSISSHRYRRKWVRWLAPVVGATPIHIDLWSEAVHSLKMS